MEPKVWEGEKKAGLIKSKFDELYSKHFQKQTGVLSFPPSQLSAIQPHYTPPAAAPTSQPAKPLHIPGTSASPVNQDYLGGTFQAQLEGFSQPAPARGTSTGAHGAELKGWPPNGYPGEELRPPQGRSPEGGSRQSEQRVVSYPTGRAQEEGGARGLTRDAEIALRTDCTEEGPFIERKEDAKGHRRATLGSMGLQTRDDLPRPNFEQPFKVVGALPEGSLPRLSWAQLPDGATVIVVSPNLVANPKLLPGKHTESQALLPVSPERLAVGDGGKRQAEGGRSYEGAHSGSVGELGIGGKRELEAGEVIQGGSNRLGKGSTKSRRADAGSPAAKLGGGLRTKLRKRGQKAKGMTRGLDGKCVERPNRTQEGKLRTAGDLKLQGSKKEQRQPSESNPKVEVETKPKVSRTARELLRLADTHSKPGVKTEVKPGVKKRRVCSLAGLGQRSGEASMVAHPFKKRKLSSGASSPRSLVARSPLLTQKALLTNKPSAATKGPRAKPLAVETGLPRLQQQTPHRKPCKTSKEPVLELFVKPGTVLKREQNAKSVSEEGLCEPSVPDSKEAGLAGKRRSEALEARAAAAPEPVCSICYTEYDARRCYVACDSCDRWYHADSFRLSPEATVALTKFKCPTCMRRGRPSGCPKPDPSAALAAPLKIRPKLRQRERVVYAKGGGVPGGPSAGLENPPTEAQNGSREARLGSKNAVGSGRSGTAAHALIVAAISVARGRKTEGLKRKVPGSTEKGTKAKSRNSCGPAQEGTGAPPPKKRPPLRLVGGTHPANLRTGALTVLDPGKVAGGLPGDAKGAFEAPGAGDCAALLRKPPSDSACLPHFASVAPAGGSVPLGEGGSASDGTNRVPLSGTTDGAGALSVPASAERETGPYGRESTAGEEAPLRSASTENGNEERNGIRKRIQPTKLGPVSQPFATASPEATEARGLEGPAGPRLAERSRNSSPAELAPAHLQGPQGNLAESQAPISYSEGPVLPSVGRYSWEAAYYRAADEAFREGPVLPDRIHTGAPRGQSARWSIDLSKVQEVDGRKESFTRAKNWVRELQRQGNSNLVIALAGNKTHLASKRKVETETYADANGLVFIETSAKSAQNVNEVFYEIARKLPKAAPAPQPQDLNLNAQGRTQPKRFCCCSLSWLSRRPKDILGPFIAAGVCRSEERFVRYI